MNGLSFRWAFGLVGAILFSIFPLRLSVAGWPQDLPEALVHIAGPGWRSLGEEGFVNVNCKPDTWIWKDNLLTCTGQPIGVMRSRQTFKNFELVVKWRHLRSAGNSGVFLWVPEEALANLKSDTLPKYGIEIQALDHGFRQQFEKQTGKKGDWFTTHGDVFAVGKSRMRPFAPTSPDGSRSFPRKNLSKGMGEWNHYYVRAINGEVRLWVNQEEVSGGNACEPREGFLCLESEGSPIEFTNITIRELS
jgi:3-keto-disaccharide hydrolase